MKAWVVGRHPSVSVSMMLNQDPEIMQYEDGRCWSGIIREGRGGRAAMELIGKFSQGTLEWNSADPKLMKPLWQEVVEAAERYNEPGKFTALIGYKLLAEVIKGVPFKDGERIEPDQRQSPASSIHQI